MNPAPRSAARFVAQAPFARAIGCIGVLGLLAACANQGPRPSATQEAARYFAHARGNYVPPGPPSDPWGPYIREASKRFDVPDPWIRAVMRVESGGNQYLNGRLVTSSAGAMGLMQVMPETYDELRDRHSLGDDPFDPHNNILAGTAYLREMYDIYGSPGFLAAYNAGPRRLDDYLSNNRALPDETRRYVAMIGPNVSGFYPTNRSPAEDYAMNTLPINIPPGSRYGRASVQLASNRGGGGRVPMRGPVEVAQLPEPPRASHQAAPRQYALLTPPSPPPAPAAQMAQTASTRGGFRLISQAVAEPIAFHRGGPVTGQWAIQVGAFSSENMAHAAVGSARDQARAELGVARPSIAGVHQPRGVLYRARLTGLSKESAVQACQHLARSHGNCVVLSPDSQS